MSEVVLQAEKRENLTKGNTKELRRNGKIPGIFYFHGEDSIAIQIDDKILKNVIQSQAHIIDLEIGKSKKKCIIRDMQWHPVTGTPLHVDLLGVTLTEKITVALPIQLVGIAIGVKQNGGVLQHLQRDLEVEGLPLDIPEHLDVDITHLDIGDSVRVSDLSLESLTILTDSTQSIVMVTAPRAIEEEVAEAEEGEGEEAEDEDETAEDEARE